MIATRADIRRLTEALYGTQNGESVADDILRLVDSTGRHGQTRGIVSQADSFLITYGDHVTREGEHPLSTLHTFLDTYAPDISTVHILPFFPYSSDDGFSVIDYTTVRPDLGDWSDIESITSTHSLMIDAVLNHVSSQSEWFEKFLASEPGFEELATVVDPETDLSQVVRPRTLPLLTRYERADGPSWVWTTFSADQIDLNYRDPATLLRVLNVIITYARHGARFLRIDAATYMWKEIGTSCVSLDNTHRLIQLFRAVLDLTYPGTMIITETNVPHEENISYFGDGTNEAQVVYNFALPPLTLHALTRGTSSYLNAWARTLRKEHTFLNFLASHDGIGLRGVEAILPTAEREALADLTRAHGGFVSNRLDNGLEVPYELNISFFDALNDPSGDVPIETQVANFVCAHSIALTLAGVPAIYLHSLVGSRSAPELVTKTGNRRSINRAQLDYEELKTELADPTSLRSMVHTALSALLARRSTLDAFDPAADQDILHDDDRLFVVRRTGKTTSLLAIHNLTDGQVDLGPNLAMLSQRKSIEPYGVHWQVTERS